MVMAKSTIKKTQTIKADEKKGVESKSTLKVESKIDTKGNKTEPKSVETKSAVQEEFKNIEVKATITEKSKKAEKKQPKKLEAKEEAKVKVKDIKTEVKSAKNENSKKTTTKAKTKDNSKVKENVKTTSKVEKKIEQKEVKKINYVEFLGEEPIKVVITENKKTTKKYPIIAVLKNYNFIKTVKVKYTEDNWNTFIEKELSFKEQEENNIEEWTTIIELTSKDKGKFKYVVSYEVNEQTYWDNNYGNDYTF